MSERLGVLWTPFLSLPPCFDWYIHDACVRTQVDGALEFCVDQHDPSVVDVSTAVVYWAHLCIKTMFQLKRFFRIKTVFLIDFLCPRLKAKNEKTVKQCSKWKKAGHWIPSKRFCALNRFCATWCRYQLRMVDLLGSNGWGGNGVGLGGTMADDFITACFMNCSLAGWGWLEW